MRASSVPGLVSALLLLAGCPGTGYEAQLGACPDGSSVTWADAQVALNTNCTRCHSSTLTGSSARFSAPTGWDYDTQADAVRDPDETWSQIYRGDMPPDANMSDEDKATLWEWYSCDSPE